MQEERVRQPRSDRRAFLATAFGCGGLGIHPLCRPPGEDGHRVEELDELGHGVLPDVRRRAANGAQGRGLEDEVGIYPCESSRIAVSLPP